MIKAILTDNGKELTDHFVANGERQPTGQHTFDKVHLALNIGRRMIPHPQTSGRVERSSGRISQIVKSTYFRSAEAMITTLEHYNQVHNHQIVQRNLRHLTPVKAMKRWCKVVG